MFDLPQVILPDRFVLDVRQEHIEVGVPGECSACPIALAGMEQIPALMTVTPEIYQASGNALTLWFPERGQVTYQAENNGCREFIQLFDSIRDETAWRREHVKPTQITFIFSSSDRIDRSFVGDVCSLTSRE